MTTLDIRPMAQLLEAQSLDMATLQDGKALLEELRRTTAPRNSGPVARV